MRFHSCLTLLVFHLTFRTAFPDVNLVTIPRREGTQLTIYNSEDITMVREHRLLTLKTGLNQIEFSWANTLIDPTSIDFRILENRDKVDLIDTTYPSGRNDALRWNISSRMSGKVPVEIRYFTSGISWSADYVGLANEDETKLTLLGYVKVLNSSGEVYDNAQTRLVVGTINLVEKIRDLAVRPAPMAEFQSVHGLMAPSKKPGPLMAAVLLEQRSMMDKRDLSNIIERAEKEKNIVKEGLSEYFLFTIEGREDIKDKEPKRLVCLRAKDVPLECLYKLSDRTGRGSFQKYYRFKNVRLLDENGKDKDLPGMENLGLSPLPDGSVRLYSEYGNRDLAYVGGTSTRYVPIGDRVEIDVGEERDISLIRRVSDQRILNIASREYRRRLNSIIVEFYDLLDYDEVFDYEEVLVSGKSKKAMVEVERRFDEKVVLWGSDARPKDWDSPNAGAYIDLHQVPGRVERVDDQHVKYFLDLEPGKQVKVCYTVTYKRRQVEPKLNIRRLRERE